MGKTLLSKEGSDSLVCKKEGRTIRQQGTKPLALQGSCKPNSLDCGDPGHWFEADFPLDVHLAAGLTGLSLKGPRKQH